MSRLRALANRRRPPADLKEAAESLFGTWRLAVRAAGFPDEPRRPWTEQEIHACLADRMRLGKAMTSWKLCRDEPALHAALRKLGPPDALLRAYRGDSKNADADADADAEKKR